MTTRPCISCRQLTRNGTRCASCAQQLAAKREAARPSAEQRGYGWRWRQLSGYVVKRDGGICYRCGLDGATTADHVIPKARGGADHPDNLRAAHRVCNSKKGSS